MKKLLLLFSFFAFFQLSAQAQEAIAKLKYEEAEEAYSNNQFELTISKLDEVEAILNKTSPLLLHLRIMAQDKIVARNPYASYAALESLRNNCNKYLQSYGSIESYEDKYREVYKLSENLKQYPQTEAEFNLVLEQIRQKEEAKKRAEEEQIRQAEIKKQEEAKIAAQKAIEEEKQREENRKINNRSALALGFQTGDVATYGIFLTDLSYKRIGLTMSLRSAILPVQEYSENDLQHYQYTGEWRYGKTLLSIGATFPILYPVWGYTSVGFGNYGMYYKYLDSDGERFYSSRNDAGIKVDTEIGLCVKLGFLILRGGYSLTNLSLKEPELTYGVGINLLGRQ